MALDIGGYTISSDLVNCLNNISNISSTVSYGPGVWSAGGNVVISRNIMGTAGDLDAGLIFGGYCSGNRHCTEEYNGTSWASGPALSRYANSGAGTQTAALSIGGVCPGDGQALSQTYEYNGSSWSSGGSLSRNAGYIGGTGTQNAALGIGGYITAYNATTCTEEYNGTSWSSGGTLPTALFYPMSAGPADDALAILSSAAYNYNGSTWSTINSLSTARTDSVGFGCSSDAVIASGYTTGVVTCTEEYNGSTWSTGNSVSTARRQNHKGTGNNSAAAYIASGNAGNSGYSPTTSATEEYVRPVL